MYLLDTDTLIYSLRRDAAVRKNLEEHVQDPIKICAITLMELYFGAYKSTKTTANLAIVRKLEDSFEVLSIGKESTETFGMLKASLQKSGTPLDDFDLAIASCALGNNLILVTNNTKHFRRISGLRITNWTIHPEKR
jgi:tRNA(fMet)-specific endonuclease VapC